MCCFMATLGRLGYRKFTLRNFLNQNSTSFWFTVQPAAGIMEIDYFYLKLLVVPLLSASFVVILKCCCMWCHRRRAAASELQHCDTPIYVIPIPANDGTDEVSLSSVAQFAPPAYDSIIPVIPPPPYSEQKTSCLDEEPPAYAEVAEEPSFIHVSPPETTDT